MSYARFDRYAALDPAKEGRDTLAALPAASLDRFTDLDPFLFRQRVNAARADTLGPLAPFDVNLQNAELAEALGGYHAEAVHFDGLSFFLGHLTNGIDDAAHNFNSPTGAFSVWVKLSTFAAPSGGGPVVFGSTSWATSQFHPFGSGGYWSVAEIGWDAQDDGRFGLGLEMAYGRAAGTATNENQVALDQWVNLFGSWSTDFPAGEKIINVFVNGVDHRAPSEDYDEGGDIGKVQWSYFDPDPTQNTGALGIPSVSADVGGGLVPADFADFQMWIGTYIEPTADNISKFISGGKPVNPSAAAEAFGQPQVLLSGDASADGFGKNKGTFGDIFVLHGSLTDASSSPSD